VRGPGGEAASDGDRTPGTLVVCCDGASRGNPGPSGAGGLACAPDGSVLAEVSAFLGETTNNVAEYYALILILEECAGSGYSSVRVLTDSKLMANQVTGAWRVKDMKLKELAPRVRALLEAYRHVEVQYVPREKNTACDALANKAVDEGLSGLKQPLLAAGEDSLF
jgi:ribonuclease HI